jgi:hypothetical protein
MSSFRVEPRRLIGDFAIPPPASSSSISWLLPNGTHFYKMRSLWHWRQCFPDTTVTSHVRKLSEPQTSRISLHCPNTTRNCNHVHSSCLFAVLSISLLSLATRRITAANRVHLVPSDGRTYCKSFKYVSSKHCLKMAVCLSNRSLLC